MSIAAGLLHVFFLPLLSSSSAKKTIPAIQTQVFLLAGQSNMVGRGGVPPGRVWDHIVPSDDTPNPRVLRLTGNLTWEEATDPLHWNIDLTKQTGVGPGMSFANSIKDYYMPRSTGLVPFAIGGTRIEDWAQGTLLYRQLITRAKVAAYGGEIRGLVWYQGENNLRWLSDQKIARFKNDTARFFQNVRDDLNIPDLPILQVALGNIGNGTNATEVEWINKLRQAQLSIHLSNLVTVSALGLSVNADLVHLTSDSQVKLGHMRATAYVLNFL